MPRGTSSFCSKSADTVRPVMLDIVDIKPVNMEELTEVITAAEFHPLHCNMFMYSSSKGTIKLADMRDQALCDKHAKRQSRLVIFRLSHLGRRLPTFLSTPDLQSSKRKKTPRIDRSSLKSSLLFRTSGSVAMEGTSSLVTTYR